MDFSKALKEVINGKKIARSGWNGKGQFVYFVPSAGYPPTTEVAKKEFGGEDVLYKAYLAFKAVDGQVVPWVASQTDILAHDWVEL